MPRIYGAGLTGWRRYHSEVSGVFILIGHMVLCDLGQMEKRKEVVLGFTLVDCLWRKKQVNWSSVTHASIPLFRLIFPQKNAISVKTIFHFHSHYVRLMALIAHALNISNLFKTCKSNTYCTWVLFHFLWNEYRWLISIFSNVLKQCIRYNVSFVLSCYCQISKCN